MNQPAILITRADAERLEDLIESRDFPGKDTLQQELLRADVVDSRDIPPNVVTMNSIARFRIEATGKEFTLKLVYPQDADGSADRVSIFAPVGAALLGLKEGDEISWPTPAGGSQTVHIIEVLEQPERNAHAAQ